MKLWSKFWRSSTRRNKQRKYAFNAPMHLKHKMAGAPLSSELRKEYNTRTIPVRKGDTVKVLRGDSKGNTGKVTKVSLARMRVFVEGVDVTRADGTKSLYPVHPSNLMITKLDLSDAKRVEKLNKLKKQN